MGYILAWLDVSLNKETMTFSARRMMGCVAFLLYLSLVGSVTAAINWFCYGTIGGLCVLILFSTTLLAQQSLRTHVSAVADALESNGIETARSAVAMIVGRNTQNMDEAAISRAAIESLAENFSDGVVVPAFWLTVFGFPGGVLYKAINTADSMIGHQNERYAAFGWAAAKCDDLVNLPGSRLASVWFILAALITPNGSSVSAFKAVIRDAYKHRSPNAGWPEAAMAGALGFKLGGPRVYGSEVADVAFMGDGRYELTRKDIRHALSLYQRACFIQLAALIMVMTLTFLFI